MILNPGAKLGPYEILEPLGAGGVGEVYKARDTRLNRAVAVKISHAQFSERFEREARTIAALSVSSNFARYAVAPAQLTEPDPDCAFGVGNALRESVTLQSGSAAPARLAVGTLPANFLLR